MSTADILTRAIPFPLKRLAARYLERRGYVRSSGATNIHGMLARRRDVIVQSVIDVGASDGRWSAELMHHFPKAEYLLVEAQSAAHGEALRQFKATHANVDYVLAAAGDRDAEVYFDASDPFGGVASPTPFAENNIVVRMAAVGTLVHERNLRPPFLLKLDTHGFEAPILEGAAQILSQCSMLIIEAYNFTLRPGCLRFYELCQFLEARGFRCVDLFDLMHRPSDHAFWQMDMVFLPASHPVFLSNEYAPDPKLGSEV
jgi:FkbM family methyltransferase